MTLGQVLWRSVDDLQRRSVTGQPGCWYSVMYSTSKAIFNMPNMPKMTLGQVLWRSVDDLK